MRITPKILIGQPADQLPEDAAQALLYIKTDGAMYLRYEGFWKRLNTDSRTATPAEKWRLLAGISTVILYRHAFDYLPTVSWTCHAAGDPNNHITPRFTALSKTSMTVVSDVNAWFSYTASPNMREATQTLEAPYTE